MQQPFKIGDRIICSHEDLLFDEDESKMFQDSSLSFSSMILAMCDTVYTTCLHKERAVLRCVRPIVMKVMTDKVWWNNFKKDPKRKKRMLKLVADLWREIKVVKHFLRVNYLGLLSTIKIHEAKHGAFKNPVILAKIRKATSPSVDLINAESSVSKLRTDLLTASS